MEPLNQSDNKDLNHQSNSDKPQISSASQSDRIEELERRRNKIILIFIFIILVFAIAGLSYFLYKEKSDSGKITYVEENQSQSEIVTEIETEKNSLTEYKNEEYDFSFEYPTEWGEVLISEGAETDHLVAGSEKDIEFSGNPNVLVGFKSSDWEHDPELGHDGVARPGFIDYATTTQQIKEYVPANTIYQDSDKIFAFVSMCVDFCSVDHPKTIIQSMINVDSSKIDGIEIYYYGDVLGQEFTDKETVWNWEKINETSPTSLLPDTDFRSILIKNFSESVKN